MSDPMDRFNVVIAAVASNPNVPGFTSRAVPNPDGTLSATVMANGIAVNVTQDALGNDTANSASQAALAAQIIQAVTGA